MSGQLIGLILFVLASVSYLLLVKKSSNRDRKNKDETKAKGKTTVQDLFEYKDISSRGITELLNGTFTATLEVSQINQRLNNNDENTAVWRKFRSLLNSIGIRHTELVQSQYLDIMDFVDHFDETASNNTTLTRQFLVAKDDVVESYREAAEEKTREVRCYVIFRFNPHKDGLEQGLQTGNATIDNLLNSVKARSNRLSDEEALDLAHSMLEEVCDLAYQLFHSLGIKAVRLNRAGVLNMVYMTFNRDLTLSQRLFDASDAHSFTEFKESQTPFLIEELAEYEDLKMQGLNVEYLGETSESSEENQFLDSENITTNEEFDTVSDSPSDSEFILQP